MTPAIVKQQFKPCDDCLEQYRSLKYYPENSCYLNILPELSTLMWSDEHPESGLATVNHNNQCKDWFHCLFTARNYRWENGEISDKHKAFWNEAQTLIPDWPGFKRSNLNDKQMESYRACSDEGQKIRDFVIQSRGEISYRCITPGFVKWMFVLHPPKVISNPKKAEGNNGHQLELPDGH